MSEEEDVGDWGLHGKADRQANDRKTKLFIEWDPAVKLRRRWRSKKLKHCLDIGIKSIGKNPKAEAI